MSTTHTPGPWRLTGTTVYALNVDGTNQFTARVEGGLIEQSQGFARTSEAEVVANARLIAAAPDLLAVAMEIYRFSLVIESAVRNGDPANDDGVFGALMKVRTAIAKATEELK
jgi:hypothetical protein